MFRPQAFGPWPVVSPGSLWNPTSLQVVGHVEDQVVPVFQTSSVRESRASVTIDENQDFALAAASGITFGVAVSGADPDIASLIVYSVSVSIHSRVTGANNRAGVNLRAWFGRLNQPAPPINSAQSRDQTTNTSKSAGTGCLMLPNKSLFIASDRHAVSTTDREFSHLSAEGQLVLDVPPNISLVQSSYPLWLGFSVFSPEGESPLSLVNITASLHLHKYRGDIETFDPNR